LEYKRKVPLFIPYPKFWKINQKIMINCVNLNDLFLKIELI
jgi:hypothetical protein